jgi:hypothetical protein
MTEITSLKEPRSKKKEKKRKKKRKHSLWEATPREVWEFTWQPLKVVDYSFHNEILPPSSSLTS